MKTSRVELVEVAPALPTLEDLIKKRKSNYVKDSVDSYGNWKFTNLKIIDSTYLM